MDELKIYIDLKPLSDDEIKINNFTLTDLWMVKDPNNKIYGPYDTHSLRKYAQRYEALFENTKVYNLDNEQWLETFNTGHFQRRKPALVKAQSLLKKDEYFLLLNGQKDGPHTQKQVQALLDGGHILPSVQISLDSGDSWIKLFEHHQFDRRTKKSNQELPFVPTKDILDHIAQTKNRVKKTNETQDAIAGLAFIGHGNDSGQTVPKDENQGDIGNEHIIAKKNSPIGRFSAASFMLIALSFIGYYQFNKSEVQDIKKAVREARTSERGINNNQRAQRKPASVKTYKDKTLNHKPIERIRRVAPKRFERKPAQKPKEIVRPETQKDERYDDEVEMLDINDPEVQEEITRQLAGEYNELDGEEPELEGEYLEDEDELFDSEMRVEHSSEDY